MTEEIKQPSNKKRNAFVALCEYASLGGWCWNLCCTTCGHGTFRVAFSKLAKGQHPDDDSFWPEIKGDGSSLYKESDKYPEFFDGLYLVSQQNLVKIVKKAKFTDIKAVAKFPDWLGYIGLVLYHCPNFSAPRQITDSFLPQFIKLVPKDSETYKLLDKKIKQNELLNISDLQEIEKGMWYLNCDK